MGYSGAGGKLIDEKSQKQKISWHCPFKVQKICILLFSYTFNLSTLTEQKHY